MTLTMERPRITLPEFLMTNDQRMETLVKHYPDSGFIRSVSERWSRFGRLSDAQWGVVNRMVAEAQPRQRSPERRSPAGVFARIIEVMDAAYAAGIRYPKIHLMGTGGETIRLARSGTASQIPGVIHITDGQRYGSNIWYGCINRDGSHTPGRDGTDGVVDTLISFNAEPANHAATYGRQTGNCCFCGRHLETRESVSAGYGPVCAENYGLPWG